MSPLEPHLADYLALRRALGFKLAQSERLLGQFLVYLAERGAETVTVEHAVAWAASPSGAHPSWSSARLSAVRGFAAYLQTIDPACELPAAELLPWRRCRGIPYIYSEEQIAALIEATGTLRTPHRASTFRTLIALLAATGMRIGEALRLDRGDIDLAAGLILVRDTKFGKTRELPLHPGAPGPLRKHLRRRDRPAAAATDVEAVFVSTNGSRLKYGAAQWTFARLAQRAGVEPRSADCRPRLHDLRHTFAVATILDGYREEAEVEPRLAALSTYLGHAEPAWSYWYLSAVPELMDLAAERLERHLGGRR